MFGLLLNVFAGVVVGVNFKYKKNFKCSRCFVGIFLYFALVFYRT